MGDGPNIEQILHPLWIGQGRLITVWVCPRPDSFDLTSNASSELILRFKPLPSDRGQATRRMSAVSDSAFDGAQC